jgi:hypothetical protein
MPGRGLDIDIAIQQAPQPGLHFIIFPASV